jgi:hypothetical protein
MLSIVHGHAGHDQVGADQFVDEAVTLGEHLVHPGLALFRRREGGMDPASRHRIGRVLSHIPVHDRVRRASRPPALDEPRRQAPRM